MGQSRKYTPEQVDKGLIALIALGNSVRASEYLKTQGIEISPDLLRQWRSTVHPDRYNDLAAEHQDHVAKIIAAESEEIIRKAAEVENLLIDRLHSEAGKLDAKDASNALRNVSTTKALNQDKLASPLRGRPTSVVEHRSLDEIKRRWEARGLIEGTAHEIPPSQLPAPDAEKARH